MSKTPKRFNPKIKITEAKKRITIGEAKLANTLPDNAQNTPIILKINDNPKEKDNN